MTKSVDLLQQLRDIDRIYITKNLKKLRGVDFCENDLKCFGGMVEDNNNGGWVSYFYNKTKPLTRFLRIKTEMVYASNKGQPTGINVYYQYLFDNPIKTKKRFHKLLPHE